MVDFFALLYSKSNKEITYFERSGTNENKKLYEKILYLSRGYRSSQQIAIESFYEQINGVMALSAYNKALDVDKNFCIGMLFQCLYGIATCNTTLEMKLQDLLIVKKLSGNNPKELKTANSSVTGIL